MMPRRRQKQSRSSSGRCLPRSLAHGSTTAARMEGRGDRSCLLRKRCQFIDSDSEQQLEPKKQMGLLLVSGNGKFCRLPQPLIVGRRGELRGVARAASENRWMEARPDEHVNEY